MPMSSPRRTFPEVSGRDEDAVLGVAAHNVEDGLEGLRARGELVCGVAVGVVKVECRERDRRPKRRLREELGLLGLLPSGHNAAPSRQGMSVVRGDSIRTEPKEGAGGVWREGSRVAAPEVSSVQDAPERPLEQEHHGTLATEQHGINKRKVETQNSIDTVRREALLPVRLGARIKQNRRSGEMHPTTQCLASRGVTVIVCPQPKVNTDDSPTSSGTTRLASLGHLVTISSADALEQYIRPSPQLFESPSVWSVWRCVRKCAATPSLRPRELQKSTATRSVGLQVTIDPLLNPMLLQDWDLPSSFSRSCCWI